MFSEQDLKYAAEFRDDVHREALAKIRRLCPEIDAVVDRYEVEDYFQQHWDYPGAWYTIVAIPAQSGSREKLIDAIVQDTLACYRGEKAAEEPDEPRESAVKRADPAEMNRCPDDPFYSVIAAYPDCAVDYCIVAGDPLPCQGCEAHGRALAAACRKLFAADEDGAGWRCDVEKARGRQIDAAELFTSVYPRDKLNYRKAFLYPPHGNRYTGADFVKVNAALFPNGTDALEVFEWTTDWSDYFDEGHEWWGALCLTVYDKKLDRFSVILASATD